MTTNRVTRGLWFGLGWIFVAIGGIGVIVPGLPTTGFMVLAASCFARSSPRFLRWILDLPGVGPAVESYRNGDGMPRRAKISALAMMTVAVFASVVFALDSVMARAIVLALWAIGVWFVGMHIPTTPEPPLS